MSSRTRLELKGTAGHSNRLSYGWRGVVVDADALAHPKAARTAGDRTIAVVVVVVVVASGEHVVVVVVVVVKAKLGLIKTAAGAIAAANGMVLRRPHKACSIVDERELWAVCRTP